MPYPTQNSQEETKGNLVTPLKIERSSIVLSISRLGSFSPCNSSFCSFQKCFQFLCPLFAQLSPAPVFLVPRVLLSAPFKLLWPASCFLSEPLCNPSPSPSLPTSSLLYYLFFYTIIYVYIYYTIYGLINVTCVVTDACSVLNWGCLLYLLYSFAFAPCKYVKSRELPKPSCTSKYNRNLSLIIVD